MTKEDAIKELKALKADYWDDDGYGRETIQYYDTMLALNMAIEALDQEPCDKCVYSTSEGCQYDDITETIPPFGDCISALNRVMEYTYGMLTAEKAGLQHLIKSMLDDMPPVNPQKPKFMAEGSDKE